MTSFRWKNRVSLKGCHFEITLHKDSGFSCASLPCSVTGSEESQLPCWELPDGGAHRAKNGGTFAAESQ